ncbi:hypothetical protein [Conchiformibius kuhniae]|uniref:Uncharacterized protein n=1 Tax=Conchiformibius kuhniae TaxID=211502 RepID=A0A8T9MS59_9NEIS|nr:hypothetical protein [Conchiformibius kuhniae]
MVANCADCFLSGSRNGGQKEMRMDAAPKKSIKAKIWAGISVVLTTIVGIVVASATNILTGLGKDTANDLIKKQLNTSPAVQDVAGKTLSNQSLAEKWQQQQLDETHIAQLDKAYEACRDAVNRSEVDLGDPLAVYEETVRCLAVDEGQGKVLRVLAESQPELAEVLNKLQPQEQ